MGEESCDLVVLGAGPGGYVAAIRAAQLGMNVTVVERERVGGVCLNWGCIPSKAILTCAEMYDEVARRGADYGIQYASLRLDYARVIARSRRAAARLVRGVEGLLRKKGIRLVSGQGRLLAPGRLAVRGEQGETVLDARNILLATGSRPRTLPGLEIDGERVVTSRQALESDRLPESVLIIGGGAIGIEFAYAYSCFGAQVSVVEMEEQLLPGIDADIVAVLARHMRRRKVQMRTGTRFVASHRDGEDTVVQVAGADGAQEELQAGLVLVAVGRTPLSEGLDLAAAGVRSEKGFVCVGPDLRTNVPGIFAIGDLVGPPLLAHKASAEGIAAVENMSDGGNRRVDPGRLPLCVYCQPEIASLGLSEAGAREQGRSVRTGRIPFAAIGKAVAAGHTDGFVKLVADADSGQILGCQIVGKGATDLIGEAALAISSEMEADDIGTTVHAHPTLSEALMEAALAVEGKSINI